MQKKTIILLRFVLILATILIVAFSRTTSGIMSPGLMVALLYLMSNLALFAVPEPRFTQPAATLLIFLIDIFAVSLALHLTDGLRTDLFLVYFLLVFITSSAQSIRGSLLIALVASVLYGWLVHQTDSGIAVNDPTILVRALFFFVVALLSSYLSAAMRRKMRGRKDLEVFTRELEDELARITETETELRLYSETVINSVVSGVIVVKDDGTITTVNPEAARVLGTVGEDIVDRNIKDMPGLATMWEKIEQGIISNRPLERLHVSITNARGDIVPVGLSVSPMNSPNTKFSGCVGILRDLSEVEELEAKLKHAERLSYLGKMATWVAHEIRNPLTAIDGFSQLLPRTRDMSKIETFSKEIARGVHRINHIIEDILTFARAKTRVKASRIDLRALLTQLTENMGNVRVFINGSEDAVVSGEEESLRSLFANIINNSIDAMDNDPVIVIKFHKMKQWLVTELTDNGRGISQDNLNKLFTPFFTTKSRGTGLGLAIVKKIVDDHRGKLEVQSAEGKGTTCRVYLPLDNGQVNGQQAAPKMARSNDEKKNSDM